MALIDGKTAFVDAMIQADKDFVTEYGGSLDPAAEPRMRVKYEKQYDALVAAITNNAVVIPSNLYTGTPPNESPVGGTGTIQ